MAEHYTTPSTVDEFRNNLEAVRQRITRVAASVGRDPSEIELLPVSKTVPEERLRVAVTAGMTKLGENKVQEAKRKSEQLTGLGIDWSVVGHLQTNKAKDITVFASEFQALDNLRQATALQRRLDMVDRVLDVYVQVNTSQESQKYGLAPDEVETFIVDLASFDRLRVKGFMTLAIFSSDEQRVRSCFRLLRSLRDRMRDEQPELIGEGGLSMGMSGDFEIAIEEGSTCVRVGQAIFGARSLPDSHYWPGASGTTN